jgi:rSAM/selenodomain-associated transferase 2
VPTLNEADVVEQTLRRARHPEAELLVVDGGSTDATVAIARAHAEVLEAPERGRAAQMNVGAAAAEGSVLLFLHADTLLPDGYAEEIRVALQNAGTVGGRFDVRLDAPGVLYAVIGTMISIRSRLSRLSTGDQGIFVRRTVFETIGGFPPVPLMEDVAFSRALRRAGRIACVRARATTSARRWQRHGVLRTIALMWALRALYAAGVPPHVLRRLYPDHSA